MRPSQLFTAFISTMLLSQSAQAGLVVRMAYLEETPPATTALANLEPRPADQGLAGATLANKDNATTGKFLGHQFKVDNLAIAMNTPSAEIYRQLEKNKQRIVVLNVPATTIDRLKADARFGQYLWINAGAPDDALRQSGCRPNLLHTLPGRAMQGDALAQYLVRQRWKKWFLVTGPKPQDALYAAAIRRAAKRFGAQIVGEKAWRYGHDARRTAQAEVPVFTQVGDYDVMIVADEAGDFGDYFPYRTWLPRPVAGTQGLVASGWHASAEQWGAVQLQNRFKTQAGRSMNSYDYAAWLGIRSIGEAAIRTGSADNSKLLAYLRGPDFEMAAFKGRSLSFRPWNGEMRQPMLVAQPKALVSLSPQDGFMHPKTDLDTLGFDAPEVKCK